MTTPRKTIAQFALDGARRFNLSAQQNESSRMLLCEATVYYAFSIEVCFKAIILHQSGNIKFEHGLSKILSQLKPDTQNQIKSYFGGPNFDHALGEVSNDFIKWRYIYEAQAAGKDLSSHLGFLRDLSNVSIYIASQIIPPAPPPPKPTAEALAKVVKEMQQRETFIPKLIKPVPTLT